MARMKAKTAVERCKEKYPGMTAAVYSMARNPEKYGIRFTPEARQLAGYISTPDLDRAQRAKPHRLTFRGGTYRLYFCSYCRRTRVYRVHAYYMSFLDNTSKGFCYFIKMSGYVWKIACSRINLLYMFSRISQYVGCKLICSRNGCSDAVHKLWRFIGYGILMDGWDFAQYIQR